jgi:predicted CXXCH cytochrome family protein
MAASLLAAILASGCLSTAGRYRVLSFFFDGVPPPQVAEETPAAVEVTIADAELMMPEPEQPPAPQSSRHPPWADRECSKCHDKAGSNRLVARGAELCWTCHENENFFSEVVHGPAAAGNCTGCHNPHRSPRPKLLLEAGADLCAQCHDQNTFPEAELHRLGQGDDCVSCHNPHSAKRAYMLRPEVATP